MKKFKLIALLLVAVVLFAGCGKKENNLTCSRTEDDEKEELTITFEDDKASYVKAVATMEAESEEIAKQELEFLKLGIAQFTQEGLKVSGERSGKKIIFTMEGDVESIRAQMEDGDSDINLDDGMNEVKKSLEKDGYTCK